MGAREWLASAVAVLLLVSLVLVLVGKMRTGMTCAVQRGES